MSSFREDQQLSRLTWTDQCYALSEFVDQNPLPQVVRVETGYYGGTDVPTLHAGEVLTLHALRKTPKLIAEDGDGNTIEIALNCPYRLQILPQRKCKLNQCGVSDLTSIYPKVKYLQVTEAYYGTATEDDTTVGETLEILGIHKYHKKVDVKNVKSGQTFTLSFTCTALFRPLRDWRSYCAKDIKTQFGFPTKVHFLNTNGGASSLQKLVSEYDVNVVGEILEVLVIATTVARGARSKLVCYEIPKDLEIQIVPAKGFVNGQRYYQELVENLHNRFDVSKFVCIQELEYFKYRQTPPTIIEHDYQSIKNIFRSANSGVSSSNGDTNDNASPVVPPRRSVSLRRTKSTEDNSRSKPVIAPKPTKLPARRTRSESVPVEFSNAHIRGENINCPTTGQGDEKYESPMPENTYETPSIYIEPQKKSGDDDNHHKSYIKTIPTVSESEIEEDPYVEISMIPEDLSPLSVQDISKILNNLGMGCYMQRFEQEQIDGSMLMSLKKCEFESLDVSYFHTKKLMKFIKGWRPKY